MVKPISSPVNSLQKEQHARSDRSVGRTGEDTGWAKVLSPRSVSPHTCTRNEPAGCVSLPHAPQPLEWQADGMLTPCETAKLTDGRQFASHTHTCTHTQAHVICWYATVAVCVRKPRSHMRLSECSDLLVVEGGRVHRLSCSCCLLEEAERAGGRGWGTGTHLWLQACRSQSTCIPSLELRN